VASADGGPPTGAIFFWQPATTHRLDNNVRKVFRQNVREWAMAVPKNDTYKDYARYAEHCLNMMVGTTDKETRRIRREWLPNGEDLRMQFADHGQQQRRR
jgi:hypothetical protein